MVYSRDSISQDQGSVLQNPIFQLRSSSMIKKVVLEARAILLIGREHAKWQPVTACGYKVHPVIQVSDTCDGCGQCVDECPRGILEGQEQEGCRDSGDSKNVPSVMFVCKHAWTPGLVTTPE